MDIIKKIFSILSSLPAFTTLFKNATQTGRIDPSDTLSALSSISPSTKKCANVAMKTVQNGGNVEDVARALKNVGEVEVMGQKIDTRTLTSDLKKAGGICSVMANVIEKMQHQSPEEIIEFGKQASSVSNWEDVIKQGNVNL